MNKKLYTACGAAAIALVACSDDNGRLVGTSVEPNTIGELSSSSVDTPSSSSFDAREGDLWNPSAGGFSLNVARYAAKLPANAKADGHWTLETDAEKGGTSSVVWPTDLVGVQDERTVVESCDGICGTVSLAKYSLTKLLFWLSCSLNRFENCFPNCLVNCLKSRNWHCWFHKCRQRRRLSSL